jgi:RND family efflux transporter MFP subunit
MVMVWLVSLRSTFGLRSLADENEDLRMKLWVKIATAILAGGLSACSTAKQPTVAAAAPAAQVQTAPSVANSSTDSVFVASGPLVVENQLDVQALREGVVTQIHAEPGTHVRAGQLLARLDDRQISADLEAAAAKVRSIEANLQNWKAETKVLQSDLDRAKKLWAANVITKEGLEHAQYKEEADEYEVQRESESLNNARNVQASLELEKQKTLITAPFDGIVARRYVRVGQKVSINDRLFWVTAMAPLEVRFTLPERFLRKLHEGENVAITSSDVSPQTKYAAKVTQISPVVDPSSGTVEIMARVVESAPDLRPGMQVNITLPNPP